MTRDLVCAACLDLRLNNHFGGNPVSVSCLRDNQCKEDKGSFSESYLNRSKPH